MGDGYVSWNKDVLPGFNLLTKPVTTFYQPNDHWGRVTHICVSNPTIIGWDNGLSPSRRQAIISNDAGILLIRPLGTNFSQILIEIHIFAFKKMHFKRSSGKWRPFCPGLNVLNVHIARTELLRQLSWYTTMQPCLRNVMEEREHIDEIYDIFFALQITCSDLSKGTRIIVPIMATRVKCLVVMSLLSLLPVLFMTWDYTCKLYFNTYLPFLLCVKYNHITNLPK